MNFSKRLKLLTLENQMNRAIQLHPFSSLSIILELYTLYIFLTSVSGDVLIIFK